jgi:hypothetical protein
LARVLFQPNSDWKQEVKIPNLSHKPRQGWGTQFNYDPGNF